MGGVSSTEGGEERRGVYRVVIGNRRERDHLEDPCIDWKIILRWFYKGH
jgi:hypothetical protein